MAFSDIPVRANGDFINASWFNTIRTQGLALTGQAGFFIKWTETGNSPVSAVENYIDVYKYTSGLAQDLYCLIKMPSTYIAGNQVLLKLAFYSPDSSGTVLMQSHTNLIRVGSDTVSQENNIHVSTNSAVTLSAGTVNIPQAVSLDLTSSTGQINSLSLSANDYIKVRLTRGTDTATSDVRVLTYGTEVKTI